ncbi:MAG: hypothetical protein PCFJNLEI_03853 [Verrucomicrobiae bacterium]|nr:hypothetical protein [Verrucomicrobiae bacterium]
MKKALLPLLLIVAGMVLLAGVAYWGESRGWDHFFCGDEGHDHHGHSH